MILKNPKNPHERTRRGRGGAVSPLSGAGGGGSGEDGVLGASPEFREGHAVGTGAPRTTRTLRLRRRPRPQTRGRAAPPPSVPQAGRTVCMTCFFREGAALIALINWLLTTHQGPSHRFTYMRRQGGRRGGPLPLRQGRSGNPWRR